MRLKLLLDVYANAITTVDRCSGRHVDGLLPVRYRHSGFAVPRSVSPVLASVDVVSGLHFRGRRGHDLH